MVAHAREDNIECIKTELAFITKQLEPGLKLIMFIVVHVREDNTDSTCTDRIGLYYKTVRTRI